MKQQDLINEVDAVVRERTANGESAAMSWIVHAVVGAHPNIAGSDSEWYSLCAYEHIRDTVREVLRGRKADEGSPEPSQADLFPGLARVQLSYTINRDGEQTVVPLEKMTDAEIIAKENELMAMATGALAHARELKAYREARTASMAM
jgi:hypothetical protein